MLVKMYKSYIPTIAETYHQIHSVVTLSQIHDIAVKYGLDSLAIVTKQEIDWRAKSESVSVYTLGSVSMCKILQKEPNKIAALEELLTCAIEHRITLFALCAQTALISFGHRNTAKRIFKQEFEKDNAFILSEFGKELMVNLYRDSSDNLLDIENCTLRKFLAEQV